jgi:hypothetical protein
MSAGSVIVRLLHAAVAGVTAAFAIAIIYAIVGLYLSGHSIAVSVIGGRPLHRLVATILVFVVPLGVAAYVFWRERTGAR